MTVEFRVGDVFDRLAEIPDGSVDLVVTSPPFLALRSYLPADHPDKAKEIGSEATPAEFLDTLLAVTAELRRVLAPHGSICIELGDTYAGSGGGGGDYLENGLREGQQQFAGSAASMRESNAAHWRQKNQKPEGWPLAKSKTLIPELYRIALAYGFNPLTGEPSPAGQWRIRNVVTWCRPNPPVGALGDKWRPATSDVVVACVSGKRFWDDLATRQPHLRWPRGPEAGMYREGAPPGGDNKKSQGDLMESGGNPSGAPLLDYWEIPLLEGEEPKPYGPKPPESPYNKVLADGTRYSRGLLGRVGTDGEGGPSSAGDNPAGAPLLDYWVIPPGGYQGSHYATFAPELVVPLVKAMCPGKVCRTCGEPSRRIVSEPSYVASDGSGKEVTPYFDAERKDGGVNAWEAKGHRTPGVKRQDTLGWTDCGHGGDWRPGLVLDCFAGSGTTGLVASGHGHDSIMIDLDERNFDLAVDRIGPLLIDGPHYVPSRDGVPADAPLDSETAGSPADHREAGD